MKNSLKKLGKLSLILMVISSFFSGLVLNVEATSVPQSFTATSEKYLSNQDDDGETYNPFAALLKK